MWLCLPLCLIIALWHSIAEGSRYWGYLKDFGNNLGNNLLHTTGIKTNEDKREATIISLVRQFEMTMWDIVSSQKENPITSKLSITNKLSNLKIDSSPKKVESLTELSAANVKALVHLSYQAVENGKKVIQVLNPENGEHASLVCSNLVSNFAIKCQFKEEKGPSSYTILIFLPLLFNMSLSPNGLRLLYHIYAEWLYKTYIQDAIKIEAERGDTILLCGASDAGLFANIIAGYLIRQYPPTAKLGNYVNSNGRVQTLTFNSPAPFTPISTELFLLAPRHFLDLRTRELDPVYSYWGYSVKCEASLDSNRCSATHDTDFCRKVYNDQAFNVVVKDKHLRKLLGISQESCEYVKISLKLSSMKTIAREAVANADDLFSTAKHQLLNEDLYECMSSLQENIQMGIYAKFMRAERHVQERNLSNNWSLNKPVTCTFMKGGEGSNVQCFVDNALLGVYQLSIEQEKMPQDSESGIDEKDDNDNILKQDEDKNKYQKMYPEIKELEEQDISSNINDQDKDVNTSINDPKKEDLSSDFSDEEDKIPSKPIVRKGLDACLKELFDFHPSLYPISPYHDDPIHLQYIKRSQVPAKCIANRLSNAKIFINMHKEQRNTLIELVTAPGLRIPSSCHNELLAPTIPKKSNSADYWNIVMDRPKYEALSSFGHGNNNNDLVLKLLGLLYKNTKGLRPSEWELDCTSEYNLLNLSRCPRICQRLNQSNFCRRVYSGPDGLKVSLRSANRYSSHVTSIPLVNRFNDEIKKQFDKSFEDFELLKNTMETSSSDWAVYGTIIYFKTKRETFYMVFFLEGETYKSFKNL